MTLPTSNLRLLLQALEPVLHPGAYAFVSVADGHALKSVDAIATMREREGLSAVLAEADAQALGLAVMFRAAWITLQVCSDLQAVGLTPAVAGALSAAGISCNVIAGAWHDHLFVPMNRAQQALAVLQRMQRDAVASGGT